MRLARRLALVLALPFAALGDDVEAAEPAAAEASTEASAGASSASVSHLGKAYLEARRNSKAATRRADGDPHGSFAFGGCMTDPSKCTCQSEDAKESSACGDVLGYFCRDSTQKYLAASCMDLFGGATVCKCASVQQITTHLEAEEAAAKKKSKGKGKGKSGSKKTKKTK